MKKGNFQKIERMANQIKWAFFIFLTLALVFVIYTGMTLAASGSGTEIYDWAFKIRGLVSTLIGILALIMIIVGGIMYTTSSGNPNQIKTAKDIIISAISGVVLYILSAVLLGGSANEQGIIGRLFPPPITYDSSSNWGGQQQQPPLAPGSQSGADGSGSSGGSGSGGGGGGGGW